MSVARHGVKWMPWGVSLWGHPRPLQIGLLLVLLKNHQLSGVPFQSQPDGPLDLGAIFGGAIIFQGAKFWSQKQRRKPQQPFWASNIRPIDCHDS